LSYPCHGGGIWATSRDAVDKGTEGDTEPLRSFKHSSPPGKVSGVMEICPCFGIGHLISHPCKCHLRKLSVVRVRRNFLLHGFISSSSSYILSLAGWGIRSSPLPGAPSLQPSLPCTRGSPFCGQGVRGGPPGVRRQHVRTVPTAPRTRNGMAGPECWKSREGASSQLGNMCSDRFFFI